MPRWFWTTALGTLAMHNTSGNFAAGNGTRHSSPAQLPPLRMTRRWLFSPGGREGALTLRSTVRACVSASQGSPQRAERVSPTRRMEPYSINVFYHPHLRGQPRSPRWLHSTHHRLVMPRMPRYRGIQGEQHARRASCQQAGNHIPNHTECDRS